jgi:zinc transporter ZupT
METGEPATERSTRLGTAVLTSFLLHLAAFVASWVNTLVGREDTSCDDAGGFCFTDKDSADLLFAVSTGFLVFSVLVSLATAAGFAPRMRSAVLAGILAALTSALVVAAVIVALFVLNAVF